MLTTLVIQPRHSSVYQYQNGGYLISYHLPEPLKLTEPHYARLISVLGVSRPVFVLADFVSLQPVNGSLEPFLGCSSEGALRNWVPLSSNYVSTVGYIQLRQADSKSMTDKIQRDCNISVLIEIASKSWIHGTKR